MTALTTSATRELSSLCVHHVVHSDCKAAPSDAVLNVIWPTLSHIYSLGATMPGHPLSEYSASTAL